MADPAFGNSSALALYQSALADNLLSATTECRPTLHAHLAGNATTNGVLERRTELGLQVYRNNVMYSLAQALAAQFPVVRKLVGEAFFGALARDYVHSEPPREPSLTYYGHEFASFIKHSPACTSLPWLADIATLEWQCQRALHAADDPVLDLEQLGAVAPDLLDGLKLVVHASVTLLVSDYPIDRIWAANLADSGELVHLDTQVRSHLLIYRRHLQVQVVSLQPPAFTLLQELQSSHSLQHAWAFTAELYALDAAELAPLLGYLFGLHVFSRFHLPFVEDKP